MKKSSPEKKTRPAPAAPVENGRPRLISPRNIAILGVILAAIYGVSKSVKKEVAEVTKTTAAAEIRPKNPDLFIPRGKNENVKREDIPNQLQDLLRNFGKVFESPADYDPQKPNVYLIPNIHFNPNDPSEENEDIYNIQEDNVNIFHVLYALGVHQQFLEGIYRDVEMQYEIVDPQINEHPAAALPKYQQTGKIRRANRAIEGIYKDKVRSVGIEDFESRRFAMENRNTLKNIDKINVNTVIAAAQTLGVDVKPGDIRDKESFKKAVDKVRELFAALTQEQQKAIIKKLIEDNKDEQVIIQAMAEDGYYTWNVRNSEFASTINKNITEKKSDSVFIIGSSHVEGLKTQIRGANVFVVGSPRYAFQLKLPVTNFKMEDHITYAAEVEKYLLGLLVDKPVSPTGDFE